jgi:hypothetical protein
MRNVVIAACAACALALLAATPARAVGTRHAFRLQGAEYPGLSYCVFDTYEQCRASASGRNLDCLANPFFAGESDDPYAYRNRGGSFLPGSYPPPPNGYPRRY